MKRPILLLAFMLAGTGPAWAADRDWQVSGSALLLSTSCARLVTVRGEAGLEGQARVTATAQRQEEIDRLSVKGGERIEITTADRSCRPLGSRDLTLEITLHVPARFAIAIRETGSTDHRLSGVSGPLSLDLSGSGNLRGGVAAPLTLDLSGSGDVELEQALGPLRLDASGSGSVTIGKVDAPKTEAVLRGSGNLRIAAGRNGVLSLRAGGSGDVTLADAQDADVEISGSGGLTLGRLSGPTRLLASGTGDVEAAAIDAPSLSVQARGSGNVEIGDGKVGTLEAVSQGSGGIDLAVSASDADLRNNGSGDIRLRAVTGRLTKENRGSGDIIIRQ